MAMGQAAGSPPRLAVEKAPPSATSPPPEIQQGMREQGADPGDIPSANATVDLDAVVGA